MQYYQIINITILLSNVYTRYVFKQNILHKKYCVCIESTGFPWQQTQQQSSHDGLHTHITGDIEDEGKPAAICFWLNHIHTQINVIYGLLKINSARYIVNLTCAHLLIEARNTKQMSVMHPKSRRFIISIICCEGRLCALTHSFCCLKPHICCFREMMVLNVWADVFTGQSLMVTINDSIYIKSLCMRMWC